MNVCGIKKILLIEDDASLHQNIKDGLTIEGFQMDSAFDGQLAEKLLKKNSYDCILLDINLPHKNGYDLCREFRQYNVLTPVLILTAFDDLEDKVTGYECGADDYMTKPFYMKELMLKIHSLIKRSENITINTGIEQILIIGDIIINQSNKKVTRQGVEVILTPREYQILLRLVSAKGELVYKRDLVKEIWGTTFDANTNTIEVYINFLRKKIDKAFGKDSIKTRIGYGYYFKE